MAVGKANGVNGTPAILVSVLDKSMYEEGIDYTREGNTVYIFHHRIPPDVIEYLITPDGIQYVGRRDKEELN